VRGVVVPYKLPVSKTKFEIWIDAARQGSPEALGQLLEACRPYLLLVGNRTLSIELQAKVGASDLVQETLLNASRGFCEFRGQTEAELLAWLKQVLLRQTASASRRFNRTQKRSLKREIRLEENREMGFTGGLVADDPSPSQQALAHERDEAVERALAQLPERYYEAIRLRQQESLSFEEIGRRLQCSSEAARKVWARAIFQLKASLDLSDESN
jgi:RNA polymerase sigma-70 factor (ECF subfamily)